MAGEPSLRRRPVSGGGRATAPPRANAMENREIDVQAMIHTVVSEFASSLNAFVRGLGLEQIKPWGEFFARFKAPREWNIKVLDERLTTNFLYYRGNYSILAVGFIIVGLVSKPSALLSLLLCGLLLTFLFPKGETPRAVKVAGRTLERSERLAATVIGVACILGLSGAWSVFVYYGSVGVFLSFLHAVFRPRSINSKATRASAEVKAATGGFTIEGAQSFVENVFGMNPSRPQ